MRGVAYDVIFGVRMTMLGLIKLPWRRVRGGQKKSQPFRLRRASFKGKGLQPPLCEGDWDAIRQHAHERRGT